MRLKRLLITPELFVGFFKPSSPDMFVRCCKGLPDDAKIHDIYLDYRGDVSVVLASETYPEVEGHIPEETGVQFAGYRKSVEVSPAALAASLGAQLASRTNRRKLVVQDGQPDTEKRPFIEAGDEPRPVKFREFL